MAARAKGAAAATGIGRQIEVFTANSIRDISPRVGHLQITLDDLPWQWADYGGSNTVILVGLPRGEHKVRIEAVDPEGGPSSRER